MEDTTPSRDDRLRELAEVAEALAEAPPDDFDTRLRLRLRRRELHAALSIPESLEELRQELAELERRREALLDERPAVAAMADGGPGQGGMAEAQELAWEFDRARGRPELEAGIRDLRRRIAEAEGSGA